MLGFFGNRTKRNDISASELQEQLNKGGKAKLIDVREPWEFEEGRIPGAILKPLGQIHTWHKELNKDDDEVVLVCRSGSRSAGAYEYLEKQGFKNLKNLSGGMIAWRGPVER